MRSVLWIIALLAGAILGALARDEPLCPVKEAIMVHQEDPYYAQRPFVDGGKTFFGGEIHKYGGKVIDVTSPIFDATTNKPTVIGKLAQMTKEDLPPIIDSAKKAWDHGQGTWPQMSPEARISAIQKVVESLKQRRELIVKVLMWEICKSLDDAQVEFDRTMKFIEAAIAEYRSSDAQEGSWRSVSGIYAKVRRLAIGIILCLGPFNYPFNETYATLIPALLMGNVVIMKIPTVGGLAHILTMEAYAEHLPPGTLNFVSGSGRVLLSPIMKSGAIDVLAFIGGSKAADELIAAHPNPHRLKVFLQLEGKNIGVVMPDANLDTAAQQIVLGATTYNGQRCTAIKTILVHQSVFSSFLEKFLPKVAALKFGLPWQAGGVQITHLPTPGKVRYLTGLVEDAVQHGATIANDQCEVYGETMLRPTVVVGVNPSMRLWHEEQFGPVIPVAVFNQTTELLQYMRETPYGQQASIFTSADVEAGHDVAGDKVQLLDALALAVGRVNINTQCGRSPDVLPFSGRRSSALGTMSVSEALRTFSVELVLAGQDTAANQQVLRNLADASTVLEVTTASPKNPATAEL